MKKIKQKITIKKIRPVRMFAWLLLLIILTLFTGIAIQANNVTAVIVFGTMSTLAIYLVMHDEGLQDLYEVEATKLGGGERSKN